jgi:hypothetical protein
MPFPQIFNAIGRMRYRIIKLQDTSWHTSLLIWVIAGNTWAQFFAARLDRKDLALLKKEIEELKRVNEKRALSSSVASVKYANWH